MMSQESKESMEPPAASTSPLFQRRQLGPQSKLTAPLSSPSIPTAAPSDLSTSSSHAPETDNLHDAPISIQVSLSSSSSFTTSAPPDAASTAASSPSLLVDEDDEINRLTDLDIAAIPIPSLPQYPSALLDPLTVLSPIVSPSTSPRASTSSPSPATGAPPPSLSSLLQPFLSAYEEQQRTLKKSHDSIAYLHGKCTVDRKAALKACEKKAIARTNLDECQLQQNKVRDKAQKGEKEKQRLERELEEKKARIEHIKAGLLKHGQDVEAEVKRWVEEKEAEVARKEEALEADRAQADAKRDELRRVREKNIAAYQQVEELQQAVQAEEAAIRQVDLERRRLDELCHARNAQRAALEDRMRQLQAGVGEKSKVKRDAEELVLQMKREVADCATTVLGLRDRLAKVAEEEAGVIAEEQRERDSLQAIRDENEARQAEIALLSRLMDSERAQAKIDRKERRKRKKLLAELTAQLADIRADCERCEGDKQAQEDEAARLTAELSGQHALIKAQQKQLEQRQSEHNILERSVEGKEAAERKKDSLYKVRQAQLHHLQLEVQAYTQLLTRKEKDVEGMETSIEAHRRHLERLSASLERSVRVVEDDSAVIAESEEEVQRLKGKLSRQTAVLDEVGRERDALRRRVIDLAADSKKERKLLDGKKREVDEWKKRITAVDNDMLERRRQDDSWRTEQLKVSAAIAASQAELDRRSAACAALREEKAELSLLASSCSDEEAVQRKQLQAICSEERVLNSQLIRREEEVQRVHSHLQLLSSRVKQARNNLRTVTSTVRTKHSDLQQWHDQLQRCLADLDRVRELTEETNTLSDALNKERRKRHGLQDETTKPINVHRWRAMRDGAGERYGMIERRRDMTRTMLQLTQQVEDKQKELQEHVAVHQQLTALLAQHEQHKSEAADSAGLVDELTAGKDKEKALANQLRVTIRRVQECEAELERLQKHGEMIKLHYFQQRSQHERAVRKDALSRQRAEAEANGRHDDEDEDDDVLKRSSFADGEVYDSEGNRVVQARAVLPAAMEQQPGSEQEERKEQVVLSD